MPMKPAIYLDMRAELVRRDLSFTDIAIRCNTSRQIVRYALSTYWGKDRIPQKPLYRHILATVADTLKHAYTDETTVLSGN